MLVKIFLTCKWVYGYYDNCTPILYFMEKWAAIHGNAKYKVSTSGRVKNIKTGRILKLRKDTQGYYFCSIRDDQNKLCHDRIHTIVADTFLLNPKNKPQVNHIDMDKKNNFLSNLERVTAHENAKHWVQKRVKRKFTMKDIGDMYKSYKVMSMCNVAKLYKVNNHTLSILLSYMHPDY